MDLNKMLIFVNNDNHSLNLVKLNATKSSYQAISFFNWVDALFASFLSILTVSLEKLKKVISFILKTPSHTRWSARANGIKHLNTFHPDIDSLLQELDNDKDETIDTHSDADHLIAKVAIVHFAYILELNRSHLVRIVRVQNDLQESHMN